MALSVVRVFQSTPPARGATAWPAAGSDSSSHFNPRPPRGGRRPDRCAASSRPERFQSTPPARGATAGAWRQRISVPISIHAPREGGDASGMSARRRRSGHFNPRPPRGGRLGGGTTTNMGGVFQSTPPARGATTRKTLPTGPLTYFNPRPPRGGRHPHRRRRAA